MRMDYTWHVQPLLREFGCGRFAMTGKASSLVNGGPNGLAFSPKYLMPYSRSNGRLGVDGSVAWHRT
jgi:hypothetical protein